MIVTVSNCEVVRSRLPFEVVTILTAIIAESHTMLIAKECDRKNILSENKEALKTGQSLGKTLDVLQ